MYERFYYVYVMTNQRHTVLYVGVSNNVFNRAGQHKDKVSKKSFTARYNIDKLVYYETYDDIGVASAREKQIKSWSRQRKIDLINTLNQQWNDLMNE